MHPDRQGRACGWPSLLLILQERREAMNMNIVNVIWDDEAKVYVAICDSLGIVLESESYDALIGRVIEAAPEMAAAKKIECSQLVFSTLNRQYAYA